MRNLLLASVALAGVTVYLPTAARAQSPVFPETTRAGKLDGAAPNSVQVSIGGTMFTAIEFQSGSGNSGDSKRTTPNLVNYIRLYPNFDYASPSGIHYGVSAEIRSNGSAQGENRSTNQLWWHSATAYVSSDKFGKLEFGTPPDAVDALGVADGDNYGTGGVYGEYGWPSGPNWIAADAYDGDVPHQKITYLSPTIAGFSLGVSYQPNSAGLSNNGGFTNTGDFGLSHNRFSGAVQYSRAFGNVAFKGDVAYTGASTGDRPTGATGSYKDVSILNVGADVTVSGFEIGGQVNTGKFTYANPIGGTDEPAMGPVQDGSKSTTAYIGVVGYTFGPASVGFQYFHADFDASQIGGTFGKGAKASAEAIGGSYTVGPGVNVNFDVAFSDISGSGYSKTHGTLVAVGSYFAW